MSTALFTEFFQKVFFVWLIIVIVQVVCGWRLFEMAGHKGWECLIPLYGSYAFCEIVYGTGWLFALQLIPWVGVVFSLKFALDAALAYGRTRLFGVGMFFISIVFYPMLAFSSDTTYEGPVPFLKK